MPEVSVIIPNYNHARYLNQRIDSVLRQTFTDFEVIILDDCSKDDSREVIEKYRGNKKITHIVYNAQNSGSTFGQWKKGIALAKGRFIWIAESDDWCEETFLERLLGPMNNEAVTVSYCQSHCLDDEGNIRWTSSHPWLEDLMEGKRFVDQYMLQMNAVFNASMALWRRDQFQYIKADFLDYRFCGDWIFWIRMALRGKVAISGRVLNYFRKHDSDVSGAVYNSGYNFKEEMKLLNTLRDDEIIDEAQLTAAIKIKFKMFWKRRKQFHRQDVREILALFKQIVPSRLDSIKIQASAIWQSARENKP